MTWYNRVAAGLHRVHGTRGLAIGVPVLMVLSLLEAALPRALQAILVAPAFLLMVLSFAMLPREGVAIQARGRALATRDDAPRLLLRRLAWAAAIAFLLLPNVFLAAYGVPHLSPWTGLIPATLQARLAAAYALAVLGLAIYYTRMSRQAAPKLRTARPVDLQATDARFTRQALQVGIVLLLSAWLWLTRGYWTSFSLLAWPVGWISAANLAALAYSAILPALMFVCMAGHADALRVLPAGRSRNLVLAHIALCITIAVLHGRNLLWLAAYQKSGLF